MIQVNNGETLTRQRITRDANGNPVGAPAEARIANAVSWVVSSTPNWDRRQNTLVERNFGLPAGSDVLVRDRLVRADGTKWDVTVLECGNLQPLSGHDFGYFVVRTEGVM